MPGKKMQLLFVCSLIFVMAKAQDQWLLAGTYTGKGSIGIYVYRFHPNTGTAELKDSFQCDNPSYLAFSEDGNFVYSISENGSTKPGAVSAFKFDQKTGHLTFLNEQHSGGDHPCYVSINKKGNWVGVANYSGGSLSVLAVNKDGSLQAPAQTIQHIGNSVVQSRQSKPHVHTVVFSPGEKYLVAADLGTDEVTAYPFSAGKAMPLDKEKAIILKFPPGSGPRHLAFHPSLPLLYAVEELTGNVGLYHFSPKSTAHIQTIASDTVSLAPDKGSADIHFSPDGRFLYTSNRGIANYLSIYSVHPKTGVLTSIGAQSVLGKTPRNFMIDPSGEFLLVANQNSNNIVFFRRNKTSGMLASADFSLNISSPVCLKMLPVKP